MKNIKVVLLACSFAISGFSQVGIGTDAVSSKAILEIASKDGNSDYKGFMPPRVPDDAAKIEIAPTAAEAGLVVYVKETKSLELWNGTHWQTTYKNETSGYVKDLFISEYVEGTGYKKAIEIANFTGKPINLSNYGVLNNSNGGRLTTDSRSNNRIGGVGGKEIIQLDNVTLEHGEVFVITYSNRSQITLEDEDYSGQADSRLDFNGDDAVILVKMDGTHVDVVGIPLLRWKFGEDVTLRRKPGYGPSPVYIPGQFDKYPVDIFDNLGSHTFE